MNIFALHDDPVKAAEMHCNKHVLKMSCEYAQLLSTAHRVLDGIETNVFYFAESGMPKSKVLNLLPGESYEFTRTEKGCIKPIITNQVCYNETHVNHPSAKWARECNENYLWLYRLFIACADEYTKRYGKIHASKKLADFLSAAPKNIKSASRTEFYCAMPEQYIVPKDPVQSYRNFYIHDKSRFAKWTNATPPDWYLAGIENNHV